MYRYEYRWVDSECSKGIEMSAHVYINTMLGWLEKTVPDKSLFPDGT